MRAHSSITRKTFQLDKNADKHGCIHVLKVHVYIVWKLNNESMPSIYNFISLYSYIKSIFIYDSVTTIGTFRKKKYQQF
jgi:hypothetical protein